MTSPRQIARRLEKALRRESLQLIHSVVPPNRFRVYLPAQFMERWQVLLPELESELAEHLLKKARRLRGLSPPGDMKVELILNPSTSRGIRIESSFSHASSLAPRLVSDPGEPYVADYALIKPVSVIGRGPADLILPADMVCVSRRHAQVVMANGLCELVDLGSRMGTFVNDRKVAHSPLQPGDRISLGEVTLTLLLGLGREKKP